MQMLQSFGYRKNTFLFSSAQVICGALKAMPDIISCKLVIPVSSTHASLRANAFVITLSHLAFQACVIFQ